jgi:hypothetical protein
MRYNEFKDKLIEEEAEYRAWSKQQLADYLGVPVEEITDEELGFGKTLEEEFEEFEKLRTKDWWIMTKPNGEEFTTVKEVTLVGRHKDPKTKKYKYEYGCLEFTLPVEWVGYTAKVVLSKKVTPKIVCSRDELGIDDLTDGTDLSDLVKIVEVDNNAEPEETREEKQKRIEESRKRDHPDWTEEDWKDWEESTAD